VETKKLQRDVNFMSIAALTLGRILFPQWHAIDACQNFWTFQNSVYDMAHSCAHAALALLTLITTDACRCGNKISVPLYKFAWSAS